MSKSDKSEPSAPLSTSSRGTIVVIDDHDTALHLFKAALQYLGYTPLLASEGTEGIELCRTHQVHLVLTDYRMPQMSGLEVAEIIKALPRPLPVVLTSASYRDPAAKPTENGVDYFLNKPFQLKELESILEQALQPKG